MQDRPTAPEQGPLEEVSLRQAVLWLALDLEPHAERFEVLEGYPRTVGGDDPRYPLTEDKRSKIEEAKKRLG